MAQAQLGTLSQTTLLSATTGKLDVCILPLWQKRLLLPATTVLEVMPIANMRPVPKNKRGAIIGFIKWEDQQVPVISFEVLNGQANAPEPQQLAIIFNIATTETMPQYAIALQAEPLMVKVKIAELEDMAQVPVSPLEYLQVRYQESLVVIPDLDAVEAKILAQL